MTPRVRLQGLELAGTASYLKEALELRQLEPSPSSASRAAQARIARLKHNVTLDSAAQQKERI